MTQTQFIASLTREQRDERVATLLQMLHDCDNREQQKQIRRALRMHDYHLRERNRVYDVRNNTFTF
jgi:hypothetical protein